MAGRRGAGRLAAVGLLVCVSGVAAGCDGGREGSLLPLGTEAPLVAATTVPLSPKEQAAQDAEVAYRRFLDVGRELATSGGSYMGNLGEVAAGDALDELQFVRSALIDEGARTRGDWTVVSVKVTSATPRKVRFVSCLDYRRSYVVGSDGEVVASKGSTRFVKEKAVARPVDGEWKITKVSSKDLDESCG